MVKKLSPLYPSSVILVSKTAKQLESERAAEEAKLREQYEAQMAALEKEARAKFEADLAAKRAVAETEFKAGLTAEKNRSQFESELRAKEAAARSQFESQLAEQERRLVVAPVRAAKREYAMVYGVQMLPRHYRAVKAAAEAGFKTLAVSEKEVMEEQVKTWKAAEVQKQGEAIGAWETEQRGKFAEDLKSWETETRQSLETQISEWKSGEMAALEPQLTEWREAWQPKGIAERMMEIKIPSLDLSGLLAKALGVKPIVQGMRLTPTGLKPIKAEFAPLAFPAGVVASVESLVYSVGQLAGLKTPKIPATLTGGFVSSAILSIQKGELMQSPELAEALQEPEYAVGTIFGDIFLGWVIGKAAEKAIIQPVGKLWRGSTAERWLYEHSKFYAKHFVGEMPLQVVGLPPMIEKEALGMTNMSKFIMGMEAFGWTEAPETVGLGITQPLIEIAKEGSKTLPYTIYRAGQQISLAFIPAEIRAASNFPLKVTRGEHITPFATTLRKALEDTKGELVLGKSPLAQVIMATPEILPKLSIIPHIAAKGLPRVAPQIFGAASVLGLHLLPREVQKSKRKTRAMPQIVSSAQAAKATVKQAPLLKEITALASSLRTVQMVPQILKSPKLITKLPRKREEPFPRIRRADIFGKLPKKKMAGYLYPVMTESEMSRYVFGKKVRSKKK